MISIPIPVYVISALAFMGAVLIAPHAKLVPQAHAAQTSVSMVGMTFSPAAITVAAGDTVVWTNNSSLQHTVTADDGSFDSGTLNQGGTYSHTFMTPGTYRYYCRFHGAPGGVGMSGTVIVTGTNQSNSNPAQNTGMNNTQPTQPSTSMPMQNSMPMPMNTSPQPSYQPAQQSSYSPSNTSYSSSSYSNNSYPNTTTSYHSSSYGGRHSCHYVSYAPYPYASYPNYSYPNYSNPYNSYSSYGAPYGGYAAPYQQMTYAQPYAHSSQYLYPMRNYGYSYPMQGSYSGY